MKIVFTGGGTGGHFYPIMAVAEALDEKIRENRILDPQFFYLAPNEYDPRSLYDQGIQFRRVYAGKRRNYFSLMNFVDLFKTAVGIFSAIFTLYDIYPDVVFSKGGYASFPTLLAARLLKIPVIIHDSDTVPGRVSLWSAKFAKKIAVSWPESASYFPKEKVAWTGNPIRKSIMTPLKNGAHEYLKLNPEIPTILIIGGSQGAKKINDVIVTAIPDLVSKYQIIHQTGIANFEEINNLMTVILKNNPNAGRYKPFDYLNELATRMSAGASDLIISRAGSAIFEIACWGVPSIIVPISREVSRDQTNNALAYARTGACTIIEETNFTPHVIVGEIDRLISRPEERAKMAQNALNFAKRDASEKIAQAILDIALEHEKV
ncbi:MAG: UDP-N-acetylglucosamine--N-acetylmuramyl-(pentapeptide) pyrophosphoryl-undecaprenol N-acetylglucosamine transferase [bacterium]|nr:UDP-N-acetylglucosamine--N-acetylmuramyl-(pentapeptide) pyrophosphoryl-undecaprenol N-acetylglucosamine transferase [bacterium]